MKLGKREIIFLVLLVAIPLTAFFMVLRPARARAAEMDKQIHEKQAKLQELQTAAAGVTDLKQDIAGLDKAITYFRSKLPEEKEVDKVLKEVWLLAEANRLSTKSIRTLQRPSDSRYTDADDPYAEQPIEMQLEGDFLGFYKFLQSLENQPRIMRVSKMKLQKSEKAPQGWMTASMSMSIFFERGVKHPAGQQSQKDKVWKPKNS